MDAEFKIEYHGVIFAFFHVPELHGIYWDFDEEPRDTAPDSDLEEIRRLCRLLDQGANRDIEPKTFVEKWLGTYVGDNESGSQAP